MREFLAPYDTEGEAFKFSFSRFWTKTRQYGSGKSTMPIRLVALSNHDKVLEHFPSKTATNVQAKDEAGRTALYRGLGLGHDRIVQMLLDRGADVNAQGGGYGSALQAASARGYDKIVQTLLDRSADISAQGGKHGNALQAASFGDHDNIVRVLRARTQLLHCLSRIRIVINNAQRGARNLLSRLSPRSSM